MSWQSAEEPESKAPPTCKALESVIVPRPRDLGGFEVRRVLPSLDRRSVGPFVFFDQMGPADLAPGQGIDVRPHPHIGLATVTYLFAGTIVHRDSLGTVQAITPGEVNWMTAGRGIVHSERSDAELRKRPGKIIRHTDLGRAAVTARGMRARLYTLRRRFAALDRRRREKHSRDCRFTVRQVIAGENPLAVILCRRDVATGSFALGRERTRRTRDLSS